MSHSRRSICGGLPTERRSQRGPLRSITVDTALAREPVCVRLARVATFARVLRVRCPRGRGEPVVVVPGFLASDFSLTELFGWLARIGYRPFFSQIGRNADCTDYVAKMLLERTARPRRDWPESTADRP